MREILEIITVIFTSSLKHTLVGIPTGYALDLNYWEVMLYTAIGGVFGIIFFMTFARTIKKLYLYILKKRGITPRKFTRTNRFIVRVKQRFGLIGLAFITPPLISVPVGAIIAATIYKNKTRVFLFLAGGVLFWSFLGSSIVGPITKLLAGM